MRLLASLVFVTAAVASADAAELKMFTSRALATVLGVIGQQFEQTEVEKDFHDGACLRYARGETAHPRCF